MHIEPGFVTPVKVILANGCAVALLAYYAKPVFTNPPLLVRSFIAAVFFSLFMQSFHLSVGPSELHFISASLMYLCLGFVPTLLGFAIGLICQAWMFDPQDLQHLGVNTLSLVIPLIAAHAAIGNKLLTRSASISWKNILQFDACFYAGVTTMVGFWLVISPVKTPMLAWAAFAASYLPIVIVEPLITICVLNLISKQHSKLLDTFIINVKNA